MHSAPKRLLLAYHRFPPIAEDLKKAFQRLGWEVEIFYTTDYEHWFYRRVVRTVNRYARSLRLIPKGKDLFKGHSLNLVNHVGSNFAEAYSRYQPDAVLVIHGLPFGAACISGIPVPRIGWHLEPRDDLPYLADNARAFDIYNSYSQKDVDLLTGAGFDCRYMSHAVDPANFHSEPGVSRKFDVTFVGNWSAWRDETLKAALEVTPNIALYGDKWSKKSTIPRQVLRQIYKGKEIVGAELNQLYNESRVVLNASRIPGSAGLNMRFFEVPAAGSMFLTDAAPELEKHFVPGTHLVLYRNCDELKRLLAELLSKPEEQDRIRLAGQRLVREQHTYDLMAAHLAAQFAEIVRRKADGTLAPG